MTNEPSTVAPSKKQAGQGGKEGGKEGKSPISFRRRRRRRPICSGTPQLAAQRPAERTERTATRGPFSVVALTDRAPHRSITSLRNARQMPTARKMKILPCQTLVPNAFHSLERSERKSQNSIGWSMVDVGKEEQGARSVVSAVHYNGAFRARSW